MTSTRHDERGIALVTVLIVLLLLLGIGAALHTAVIGETSARGAHLRATTGFYAAEAGINRGMGDYRDIFLNYNIPSGTDFAAHTFTINGRTVNYQLADTAGNPFLVLVPAGRLFAGLNATEYRYSVNATSQLVSGNTEATIGTKFNIDYIPIFQFLAFYQGDLEILPGADALFHGPIHTNGNLYLNSNATLTIADCLTTGANPCPQAIPTVHLSAAANVYRGRKDTSTCTGTVQVSKLVDSDHNGALDLQAMSCGSGTTQESPSILASWLGSILSRQSVVSVPAPGILSRVPPGDYWNRADLRIVLDLDNPDAGRFPIVAQTAGGAVSGPQNLSLQAFFNAKPGRLFYSDVPDAAKRGNSDCNPAVNNSYCHRNSYNPQFTAQNDVYACAGTDLNLYTGCAATVANLTLGSGQKTARRGGFYGNREHDWVYMLNLNLHDLLAWNRAQPAASRLFDPTNASDGGIVLFLSVMGGGSNVNCSQTPLVGCSSPRYAVRVFGSPNLDFPAGLADPTGVTVVSDQAVFVEGTYNNGTGNCTFGNGACPKMPSAFMGDTVNVLSNNWSNGGTCRNDCQSYQPLASRAAATTTVYGAFLSGVDVTRPGNYNGGFENYPRFHESWSGIQLFYRGSFVSLGTPVHSNGQWCGTGGSCTPGTGGCGASGSCNIYNAPTRNWDFDTDFQDAAKLPPVTPRFVTVQQILFTENFR